MTRAARYSEGADALTDMVKFLPHTISSGVIPQISVIMAPCAMAVYLTCFDRLILMAKHQPDVHYRPLVIGATTGEDVKQEALGKTLNQFSGGHSWQPMMMTALAQIKARSAIAL